MEYNQSNFLCETIVPQNELIVSRTDLQGNITYANEIFATISDYTIEELIGKPHSCVRHPDMPKAIFQELWDNLRTKGRWSGFIKNIRKDFAYYWVYAEVSGVYKDDKLVEYKSIRTPISFDDKVYYQAKYDEMKNKEGELVRRISYEPYNS